MILLVLLGLASLGNNVECSEEIHVTKPNLITNFYQQQVDHFGYGVQHLTFMQKYLLNLDHWNRTGGPIFFYAGNEGAIELFAANTGFMFEIAPEFGAMIVFAEHRYYGQSLPFGNKAYSHKQYYQYQSSMQALADYAQLITHIRAQYQGAADSPVVVFGGSYGGMLAAWMRIKYPNVVQGAIAASAPVAQFTGLTPCNRFGEVVTEVFANQSTECSSTIRESWGAIDTITKTDKGKAWLSAEWQLCKPLNTSADIDQLKAYLTDVWTNLAMADYPYMANFLAPLPAYPVMAVCHPMVLYEGQPMLILKELFKGLSVYFNYSTQAKCLDYGDANPGSLSNKGWSLQSCTEMVMPFCYDGKKDFFQPSAWNLTEFDADCYKKWGTHPEPYKMEVMYGGRNLKHASNIVFSNGLLDPWSTGGVLVDQNPSVVAVIIPEGAHHLDLRASELADPKSVLAARALHRQHIAKWIAEHRQLSPSSGF